jgi:predicted DNA-binding transcriptional regulator YafY
MLIILQLRGRVTAQALADEFEISVRSVYRDIDALSAAGVPVYADRGPGGGFSLLDGYRTRLTGLTGDEAGTVLLAGLPGAAADLGLMQEAAAARLKLVAALSADAGKSATRIGERFHLDPVDWYRRAKPPAHLPLVARCLWEEKRLSFRYEGWPPGHRRKLDPLGLVLKAGAWYLVARSGGRVRTYKVERMMETSALDEGYDYPAAFDLAAHWRTDLERFEKSLWRGEARLRVSAAAASWLHGLGTEVTDAIMAAPVGADGCREAVIPVESVEHAARQIASFGDEIEVIAPAALRRRLAEHARRILALYDRDAQ